ncbi:MAG: pirin family protein [Bacteroidota bacterium]|nr:pirin family protein [Bacteroidota bacterium]
MSQRRKLVRKYTPADNPGFLGPGHIARAVIQGGFMETDPFILLMDDTLDKKNDDPVGGPHPHAGFETVTLLLEGEMGEGPDRMKGGDMQMMTAGGGIIHTETIAKKAKLRLLQLWLTLPKKDRWTTPRIQDISMDHVPEISLDGTVIKVYSGSLAGITSPMRNYTPVIIADIRIQPNASASLKLPATYSTFLYVLDGAVLVGDEKKLLDHNEVGWLDRFKEEGESDLRLSATESGTRLVLYSAQPQGDEIVPHGPFIGDTNEDIIRLYQEFRSGKMKHISTIDKAQKLMW